MNEIARGVGRVLPAPAYESRKLSSTNYRDRLQNISGTVLPDRLHNISPASAQESTLKNIMKILDNPMYFNY
ncbi:uncharacterized protein Dmul_28030 [Desulfococcus multivorans]|nr:uncharacterized protein Dmul_28030 [Desulfococcus multivorans]